MFSCQFYLLSLIKYLQTISLWSLASWGSSLKETINFLLYSICWLDALWRKNWYESIEMKTAILLPSTVACCYMLLSFISWFYSFVWSNASEWSYQITTDCEAVLRSTGAHLPCCLLSIPLLQIPEVSFLLFIWSPFFSTYDIKLLQNIKKLTNYWEDVTLLQAKHGLQEGLK